MRLVYSVCVIDSGVLLKIILFTPPCLTTMDTFLGEGVRPRTPEDHLVGHVESRVKAVLVEVHIAHGLPHGIAPQLRRPNVSERELLHA